MLKRGEKNPNPKTEISLQPDKLLADAQSMASQDQLKEITAMANKIQVQRSRGAFGGPKVTQGQSVEMKATVAYTIDFNGGEKAELVVVGDSGAIWIWRYLTKPGSWWPAMWLAPKNAWYRGFRPKMAVSPSRSKISAAKKTAIL